MLFKVTRHAPASSCDGSTIVEGFVVTVTPDSATQDLKSMGYMHQEILRTAGLVPASGPRLPRVGSPHPDRPHWYMYTPGELQCMSQTSYLYTATYVPAAFTVESGSVADLVPLNVDAQGKVMVVAYDGKPPVVADVQAYRSKPALKLSWPSAKPRHATAHRVGSLNSGPWLQAIGLGALAEGYVDSIHRWMIADHSVSPAVYGYPGVTTMTFVYREETWLDVALFRGPDGRVPSDVVPPYVATNTPNGFTPGQTGNGWATYLASPLWDFKSLFPQETINATKQDPGAGIGASILASFSGGPYIV